MFDVECLLFVFAGTNSIPHLGHLPGWSCTTSGCMTQVYCVASGFGVCARSAKPIVTIKIRIRKFLSIVEVRNTSAGLSPAEASDLLTQCAYRAQQWPPEQHLPPPQQSALREVAVAVPIMARVVIIIKRYFIESLLLN